MHTPYRSRLVGTALLAMALAGSLALAGCTAAQSVPTATPTKVSTADWPTADLYHEGRSTVALVLPAGARTLHVDFTCTSGLYSISPDLGMDDRSGSCGGAQSFDFDVTTASPGRRVTVDVVVPDDTRFAAALRFSPRPVAPNPVTKKQCTALTPIIEAYWNADQGHDHGDVSDAQWSAQTAQAKADLTALATEAKAQSESTSLLSTVIPQLADWLTGAGDRPGGILHPQLGDFTAANALAGQICTANGTPIAIHSKYGG